MCFRKHRSLFQESNPMREVSALEGASAFVYGPTNKTKEPAAKESSASVESSSARTE